MSEEKKHEELIIIKRYEDEEHDHHSSAWKVAHADFMTAMMAFFLIMWLINVTDEEVKKSIANYFNPVKLSASVTDRKGLNDPEHVSPQGPEEPGDEKTTLHPGAPGDIAEAAEHQAQGQAAGGGTGTAAGEEHAKSEATEAEHAEAEHAEAADHSAAAAAPSGEVAAELAAFRDPYAVLAELASEVAAPENGGDPVPGETGAESLPGNEVTRDPFDPVYWLMESGAGMRSERPADAELAEGLPEDRLPDARAPRETPDEVMKVQAYDFADAGLDVEPVAMPAPAMEEMFPKAERAAAIKEEIVGALEERLGAADAPTVEVKATDEGILISLTDDLDFSMFEIGSAIPKPVVVAAMDEIAGVLATMPGDIVLRGHTDGRPFRSDTYDNWRLSTARAHMAYYMLTRNDFPESRVRTVEGFADRQLKVVGDPNAPENRRIEILLKEPSV